MTKSKSKLIHVKDVQIVDVGDQGMGIGKDSEGQVYLIQNAVPGDIMDIEVKMKRSRVSYARPIERTVDSTWRQLAFCSHFGVCGGCKWQHMAYKGQLEYKQKNVFDALTRIGGIKDLNIRTIEGVTEDRFYRNKLDFSFGNNKWLQIEEMDDPSILNKNALGFHRPGSFEKIVDIQYCYLQSDPSNEIRNFIREYAHIHHLTFYNVKLHTGLLRNLVIRTALDGSTMVTMVYGEDQPVRISEINAAIIDRFPDITLYTIINLKFNDTTFDLEPLLVHGRGYLLETLGHLKCRVGPKSFFQTNSSQAKRLYEFIEEFADLKGSELIYDLYSGTGTIGLFLAHRASKIIGVEEINEAVQDAMLNARENEIENAIFYTGDVKKILLEGLFEKEGRPDLIILDPPRSGLHPDNIPILLASGAPRIIYVSCNPATQARDLKLLATGYNHVVSQPVDMFPHTGHIENVTLLHQSIK